jgi:hypothetical protein
MPSKLPMDTHANFGNSEIKKKQRILRQMEGPKQGEGGSNERFGKTGGKH